MTTFGDAVFQNGGWPVMGAGGYPADYPGKVYFVNNITGSSSNDGLTWSTAFAEVSQAITAAEAYRQLPALATNEYIRNIIYVQGTGTPYTALTAFPNYCDVIGVGSFAFGDGAGIPCIGDGATADLDGAAGSARGLRLLNLQFISSGNSWALDFVNLFRSEIAFCALKAADPTLATVHTDGGIRFTGAAGGLYIHDNNWIGANDSWHMHGIWAGGTHLNSCKIENNQIRAETAGVHIAATVNGDNTVFKSNVIHGGQRTLALGVNDIATAGFAVYAGNYISATKSNVLSNLGETRWIGNYWKNDFAAVNAS
jgi:hypothetical protein